MTEQEEEEVEKLEEDQEDKIVEDPEYVAKLQGFKDNIKSGLKNLSQIACNTSYAYVKLDLQEKEIDKLYEPLLGYKHLRYLDLSGNQLTDVSMVVQLEFLLVLNVSKNQIPSLKVFNPEADEEVLPHLQFLNISENKITELEELRLKSLRRLVLSTNEITSAEKFKGHKNLEYLDLKTNKLKNCKGLAFMPNLKELELEENEITDFRDLSEMEQLKKLNLKKNQIKKIKAQFPYLPRLYSFNVAENQLANMKELFRISKLKSIFAINIADNPFAAELGDNIKREILMVLPYFEEINGEPVTNEDRQDAINTLKEQAEAEEQKRREEEEARRQEEAEKQGGGEQAVEEEQ